MVGRAMRRSLTRRHYAAPKPVLAPVVPLPGSVLPSPRARATLFDRERLRSWPSRAAVPPPRAALGGVPGVGALPPAAPRRAWLPPH